MDAIAPALIGLGLWFAYHAWTNPNPHPVAGILAKLGGPTPADTVTPLGPAGSPTQPSITTNGAAGQIDPGFSVQPN